MLPTKNTHPDTTFSSLTDEEVSHEYQLAWETLHGYDVVIDEGETMHLEGLLEVDTVGMLTTNYDTHLKAVSHWNTRLERLGYELAERHLLS